ncbi:MAG: hypothetical protein CM15mP120_08040 [Pseudomonadota bacterium]|nr:MAG: hypothetical protein CM15mP120_08040 [Pseudomonadota bacterium]
MRRVGYWLESLELIGAFITRPLRWFVLIMVLTTVTVVVLRYALETGAIFLQESVMYLHGLFSCWPWPLALLRTPMYVSIFSTAA